MSIDHRHSASGAQRAAAGHAVAPWAGVCAAMTFVVVLNVVAHPVVSAAAATSLALLALRLRRGRLVATALVTGIGLVLLEPVLIRVFGGGLGSARLHSTYGGAAGVAWLAGAAMRVPAQVLACVPLLLVEPEWMIGWIGRIAPRAAFAAALAGRIGPMLRDDATRARDDVRARGSVLAGPFDAGWNLEAWRQLWRAVAGGAFDRAAATAIALESRGYGSARPTTAPLGHPALGRRVARSPARDGLLVAFAIAALLVAVVGRVRGDVGPTSFDVFAGAAAATTPLSLLLAGLLAGMVAVLATPLRHGTAANEVSAPPATSAAIAGSAPMGASGDQAAAADGPTASRSTTSRRGPGAPGPPVLQLRGVELRYPGAAAPALVLDRLDVQAGELVVVAGPSGCGKSTLLDVVSGIAPHATGGRVQGALHIAGRPALGLDVATRSRQVALAMQEPERQVLATTVGEEVALGLRLRGLPASEVTARTLDTLQEGGLLHLAARRMATLSGGELQRVLLAAALATRPAVLLLDEPTAQLDDATAQAFWQHVRAAARRDGTAVLATEHRVELVHGIADRIVELSGAEAAEPLPIFPGLGSGQPERVVLQGIGVRTPGGGRTLVDGLDLVARAGEVVVVAGSNGSGKSTVLRALRGLHPRSGWMTIDGRAPGRPESMAGSIAWLSQQAGVQVDGETVGAVLHERARRARLAPAVAEVALADAGLVHLAMRHPLDVSVGERQRLAIAAATLHAPALWLLDEPTRGMDATARSWLVHRLARHAMRGGVTFLATHDAELAHAVATQRIDLASRSGWRPVHVRPAPSAFPHRAPEASAVTGRPGGRT